MKVTMALYSLSVKNISRGKGYSVIAAAAYRSGERLEDRYYGKTHDYTEKHGIVHRQILLPQTAPREYFDRETLWNAVEMTERRSNSRLAKEVRVALPRELTLEDNVRTVEGFVIDNFIKIGMCADVTIHDKGDGNPHAHILLTTRPVTPEGFKGNKERSWDTKPVLVQWRKEWADCQNREYERHGLTFRIDHRSLIEQGLDREPTIHLGHRVSELERKGIQTDRGDEYHAIVERNEKRKEREEQEHQQEQKRGRSLDRGR
jgi:ATP-dependent exoDNAse (exonuclease V) alpha subunit